MLFIIEIVKVYLEVYGCSANQGDASIMQGIIEKEGHEIVSKKEDADAFVLVTCTVIDTTQQRMINKIKEMKKYRKKFIVAGCMASAQPELIKKIHASAELLPPNYVHCISNLLNGNKKFYPSLKSGLPRKIDLRLNYPISDGCLYNCSYCITKRARGKLVSYPVEQIVDDLRNAVEKGCKEIRLTSQDTAGYGRDIAESLPNLINKVSDIDGKFRIRIGMMHPLSAYRIIDELIDAYKNEKVYKFLHLPLQSGSPEILKAMRRGYTPEMFKEVVDEFRKKFRDFTLATDVIVAFPGEDEEHFKMSIDAIFEIKPDVTNITRFSPRPNTDAKKMKKISTKIAKERSKILTEITNKISLERNKKLIGREFECLILEKYKEYYIGKTNSYKSVFVKDAEIGKFIKVRTISATPTHLNATYLN
ncbi:MAG TPA: tRNA (N(6)-L-threonylcarbamoyladenosine(37)-C(2))-methylthiotransferase [Thermoplasmatales archaeon]|nr:tRNA (N(6)-L-threonylcarbamoyladenosine(37)-C(2))-methylthiotransferase [Thermoplasmatales archaeon]